MYFDIYTNYLTSNPKIALAKVREAMANIPQKSRSAPAKFAVRRPLTETLGVLVSS